MSARAGWTAELSFYGLKPLHMQAKLQRRAAAVMAAAAAQAEREGGRRAPQAAHTIRVNQGAMGLVLVDTPGYGFTVGNQQQLLAWGQLIADYLDNSSRLRLAVLLVDATRGVCAADVRILNRLRRANVPVLVALTKADLLDAQVCEWACGCEY